jgi:tetratricopeptide (TPR) repeat protein
MFLFFSEKIREAIDVLEASIAGRDATGARYNLAQCYARMAQLSPGTASEEYYRKALEQAADMEAIERRSGARVAFADQMYALIYSLKGDRTAAAAPLERILADMAEHRTSPVTVAWTYTAQRRYPEALDLLERAAGWRDRRLMYIRVNPFVRDLSDQPRFKKLIAEMRL